MIKRHTSALEKNGPMARFWNSFIDMVDILFAFTRSLRTGDWNLHIAATQKMLPWFFAYDRQNYARYSSLYLSEMKQLETTHPAVYKEFM